MTRAQTTIMLCLGILAYGATGQAQDAPQTSQRPLTRGSEAQVEAAPVFEPQQVTAEDRPKIRDPRMSRPLALAHKAMREEDWLLALERAKGDGPLAVDMITWHALRSGLGTPTDVMSFLARRPDWPGLPYLKEKSELTMANAAVSDVLAFFEGYTPRTGTGALTLAKALRTTRQSEAADAVLVRAWTSLSLEAEEHDSFLSTHADLLAPYHDKRLDMTLWEGWTSNPRRMESLVSEGLWDLAQARMAMRATGAPGDMSEALTDNAGLAYER
ncbi:MAG: hypothetical protein MK098_09480, partial [Marinovum sp.]|nr:hypothetical protein [Marinovum sp.]